MTATIQIRRDTIANWDSASPAATLAAGEIGIAYDAGGAVHGIKVGPSAGGSWTSLPYLSGTLPILDVSGVTDWNTASLRTTGRFIVTSGVHTWTNGPSGSIALVSDDGQATCLSLAYGTTHLHIVTTEGNAAATPNPVPAKMLFRIYDGNASPAAWRDWTPLSLWSSSDGTTGVNITAKSITLKDTATGLTVDGNSVLTGNVTVNGTTTLGNANADIVTVQAGTAANPIITTTGDTDTGVFFPSANKVAFAAGGVQQLVVDSAQADVLAAIFRAGATFNERIDMNGSRITDMGAPSALTDAMNLSSFLDRIAIIGPSSSPGTTYTASNGSSWTLTNLTGPRWTAATGGNYDGVVLAFDGNAALLPANCRTFNNDPSPIDGNGNAVYAALIAIKRS